ncbi:ArdC family protein [Pengzhenrongella phosphoraccumulans]|uniref:ArdC family protein n=1 Tax=Pengzhenrongella phosphoraccumulans TaxID=3114394 RepID=UPI00388D4661
MTTTRSEKSGSSSSVDRLALAHESLVALVQGLQSSADWQRALATAAHFHRYSFVNSLLIASSHARAFQAGLVSDPVPEVVAGYATWKALGRQVIAGQHGHTILCPRNRTIHEAVTPDGERRPIDRGATPAPGETAVTRRNVVGWTTGTVFSLSQTDGAVLPLAPRPVLLEGQAPAGLWAGLAQQVRVAGFELADVANAAVLDGANGVTDFGSRQLRVRADMDPAARTKTLSHELGHVVLHAPHIVAGQLVGPSVPRHVSEVEAESVAYLIGAAHGMTTTAYTLPYVASWAGGADPAATVRATAERVVRAARGILDTLATDHGLGGRPPGADLILERPRDRRAPVREVPARQGVTR